MLPKEAICYPKFIQNMTNITTRENRLRKKFKSPASKERQERVATLQSKSQDLKELKKES
tara:strand:- start:1074 stop:1253 length:180 start_codon:yes stop_codon:yes gene_type:complete